MTRMRWMTVILSVLFFCAAIPAAYAFEAQFGRLPPNVNPEYGGDVDKLYYHIMILVAVMFFLTEGYLLLAIIIFRSRPDRKASYSHGNLKAEIFWSVVPCIILVWLAFHQRETWFRAKTNFPTRQSHPDLVVVQAFPEQFQWNFRYPGADDQFGTPDDIVIVGELHLPVNRTVVIHMTAKDVIHSFFLPFGRVKQDVVPGMLTKVWFKVDRVACWDLKTQALALMTEEEFRGKKVALSRVDYLKYLNFEMKEDPIDRDGNVVNVKTTLWAGYERYYYQLPAADPKKKVKPVSCVLQDNFDSMPREQAETEITHVLHYFEIACAELCGLGHYKMRATMIVETPEMYETWLKDKAAEEAQSAPTKEETERYNAIWDKFHPDYNKR